MKKMNLKSPNKKKSKFSKNFEKIIDLSHQYKYNINIINAKQIKALTETKMFVD